jgi:hypothetical protein
MLAGLAAILVGTSACNSATPGQPAPTATVTAGGQSQGTTTSGAGVSGLPVDHACSLLSSSDLTRLGASSPPTQDMIGTAHACELDNSDDHIIVGIRTNVGLDGFNPNGGTVHDTTVGTHHAKQVVDSTGSCVIAVGVSDKSRVDVTVTPILTADPCTTAMTVANLIEPKLP